VATACDQMKIVEILLVIKPLSHLKTNTKTRLVKNVNDYGFWAIAGNIFRISLESLNACLFDLLQSPPNS
jgi:hypothetical protein